jgi:hypothetical protein
MIIINEEEEEMEISKEKLEAFFQWLKDDGLVPKKSERLWRKTITKKLLNLDVMTTENYQDFLKEHEQKLKDQIPETSLKIDSKVMIGIRVKVEGISKTIKRSVDVDSYLHLFFDDGSDKIISKKNCLNILESLP